MHLGWEQFPPVEPPRVKRYYDTKWYLTLQKCLTSCKSKSCKAKLSGDDGIQMSRHTAPCKINFETLLISASFWISSKLIFTTPPFCICCFGSGVQFQFHFQPTLKTGEEVGVSRFDYILCGWGEPRVAQYYLFSVECLHLFDRDCN